MKDLECAFPETRLKRLTLVWASVRILVTWWGISLQQSTDLGQNSAIPGRSSSGGVIRGMTTRHGIELTWVWVLAPLARASGRAILLGRPYSPLVNQG